MKALFRFSALALVLAMVVSCVSQMERMTRPDGSTYTYHYGQIGGAGTGNSSSGTSATFDGQKSFQDFLAAVGVSVVAWSQASIAKAKEISAQYQAGQITKQQAQQQMHTLKMAEAAGKGQAYGAALEHGAVPTVGTVTPP